MRHLILYFSGTGNTHYVAHYLGRKLEAVGVSSTVRSLEQLPPHETAAFDVVTVGFPTYGCAAPAPVQEYLERMPPGKGRGSFLFCTKGAYAGGTVNRGLSVLAQKGYVPLGGGSVTMPGSDGLLFVGPHSWMARSALNKDFDHLKDADRLVQRMGQVLGSLVKGQPVQRYRVPVPPHGRISAGDRVWAYLYDRFAEPMKRKF